MNRLWLTLAAITYIGLTLFNYSTLIAPIYAYMGLDFAPVSSAALGLSIVMALLPLLWMPTDSQRPSVLVYYILYVLLYIPACIVPTCTPRADPAAMVTYQAFLVFCFALLGMIYHLPMLNVSGLSLAPGTYWPLLGVWTVGCCGLIVSQFGISFRLPSVSEIYSVRTEFKDAMSAANSGLTYLILWQSKIIAPLVLIHGVRERKILYAGLALGSQLLIFSITGHKTVLASGLFLVLLYFVFWLFERRILVTLLTGICCVTAACTVADLWLDDDLPRVSAMIVRRNVLIPGLLSGIYYEFFSNNPKALLGHSILSSYIDYAYSVPPALVIGLTYFRDADCSCNASFWSDGYANFGFPGVLGATLLLGLLLWLFDSGAVGCDTRTATLMLAMPAMSLVNSGLLTVIQSHGFLIGMFLIYFMPRPTPPPPSAVAAGPPALRPLPLARAA